VSIVIQSVRGRSCWRAFQVQRLRDRRLPAASAGQFEDAPDDDGFPRVDTTLDM